jgi:ribosome-binding protein aMBF1 (putative translation factor)
MTLKTCAACDCELDANPIKVKVGGNTVEVCCADCALALNEADAATSNATFPSPATRPAVRQGG